MLNISPAPECATPKLDHGNYAAMALVGEGRAARTFGRLVTVAVVIFLGALFLPWTQNIRARGTLTSLSPDQRPQTIHAVIPDVSSNGMFRKDSSFKRVIPSCASAK